MASVRQLKFSEEIRRYAGDFIAQEAARLSLITPTRVDISPDLKNCTIYVSVFPEDKEDFAINFLKRKRSEFRTYLIEKAKFKTLPLVDFVIDLGEKNRQLVDQVKI